MVVEITKVKINEGEIVITGNNLEKIFTGNIYDEFDNKEVEFRFSREDYYGSGYKYLYKLTAKMKNSKELTSFGLRVEALKGEILNLPDIYQKTATRKKK